jgi:hypothetical protein
MAKKAKKKVKKAPLGSGIAKQGANTLSGRGKGLNARINCIESGGRWVGGKCVK